MTPLQITLVILLVTIIAFASGKIPIAVISSRNHDRTYPDRSQNPRRSIQRIC